MELIDEPHEDVIQLANCVKNVAWLDSTMAVAVTDREAGA